MERHGAPKSAGLAGVSSEVRLGDGWLVCSALLLAWSKLKLIRSILDGYFTSPKNTRTPPPPQAQAQAPRPPKPPHMQKVSASIPPSGAAVLLWLFLLPSLLAAVAAAAFGGACWPCCWQWSFFSGAGARKWCCCQCISATGVLLLGLMWCW